jgi:fucose permease
MTTTASYRRDAATWAAFAALLSFGVLNAGLGPLLPYIRAAEHISYLAVVLHQVAFAIGGGLAGLLAAAAPERPRRDVAIAAGLAGAGVAWLGIGYGGTLALTAGAAFAVSLLGTSALIRLWGALADIHGPRRAVAMAEGEIWVSLGSIATPLVIGALAATALGWRSSSVAIGAVLVAASLACRSVRMPAPRPRSEPSLPRTGRRPHPTLVIVVAVVAIEFSLSFWLASYLGDDLGLGRGLAVTMVSVLYAANLAGRLVASRMVRRLSAAAVLAGAFGLALAGLPVLLAAKGAAAAVVGLALAGMAIGAFFPLVSSLHVGASARTADGAIGEVLAAASIGQVLGPVLVAALAQAADLRTGLLTLPALVLLAGVALRAHVTATQRMRAA